MLPENFLPLFTERLVLRRFVDLDLDRFLSYRQDAQVARFQGWSMLSSSEAQAFIQEMQTAAIGVPGEWFQIAIAHKQSNRLLGDIGLHIYSEAPAAAEIGFTLAAQEQGKGYAQEAVQALIDSLFELGALQKIVGITDARNAPSIRLLKRLGMGLVRSDTVVFKQELCVEQIFELARKDWRPSPKSHGS